MTQTFANDCEIPPSPNRTDQGVGPQRFLSCCFKIESKTPMHVLFCFVLLLEQFEHSAGWLSRNPSSICSLVHPRLGGNTVGLCINDLSCCVREKHQQGSVSTRSINTPILYVVCVLPPCAPIPSMQVRSTRNLEFKTTSIIFLVHNKSSRPKLGAHPLVVSVANSQALLLRA